MKSDRQSEKAFLSSYNIHDYDIPLTTVDIAIFTVRKGLLQVLLIKRSQHPALGRWALPGGFVDVHKDRDLEATATRKLKEKTGVSTPYLEQVGTFGNGRRDPRGWSITVSYFALLAWEHIQAGDKESNDEVAWLPVAEVMAEYDLAFDHEAILASCVQRLKNKVQYTSIAINLLADTFTLSELQSIFELILEKPLEKKSFRRRMLDAQILEETGELRSGGNRPAKLYKAKNTMTEHFFPRVIEGSR